MKAVAIAPIEVAVLRARSPEANAALALDPAQFVLRADLIARDDWTRALAELAPSIRAVLVDLRGTRGLGAELVGLIRLTRPALRIVVLADPGDGLTAADALAGGAAGIVTRDATPTTLARALHQVLHGGVYLSQTARRAMLRTVDSAASLPNAT